MADRSNKCRFAESTCSPGPEITYKAQQAIVLKCLLPWLNFHLKGDLASAEQFDALLESDPSIEFERKNK
jgi:hypothetical protein